LAENAVDLEEVTVGRGVVWTLRAGEDLNANLVRFADGGGVGEHVNDEVGVILVGVCGSGSVVVDGHEHALGAGKLVFVPKGSRRSTRSASEGFTYLTVHKRRGPLQIGAGR
jgi:quercetin dioxygenase-like cupin family protein